MRRGPPKLVQNQDAEVSHVQLVTHVPLTQLGEAVGQTLPHLPQLLLSLDTSVHELSQHSSPTSQQLPLQQTTAAPVILKQRLPQVPQFLGSVFRLVHMPP